MTRTEQTTWRPGTVREAAGGLVALTLATFVAITTELVPVGLLPQISTDLEVTESVAGLLVTVYAFMVAALAIPLTLGTRRLPRKGLLLVTLVAYTVSNALVGIAPSFGLVAAGRAVGGIAHALFFSLSIGYASRLVLPQVTGRALALVTAGASAGLVLGVPLSTALGTAVGWRNGFLVLAAGCALATVLVATLLPPVSGDDAPHADHTRTDRRRRLGIVSTTNTLTYLAQYTVYTYVSVILLATGLTETAVGPVLLGLGAVGLVGTAYAAVSLDRQPAPRHPRRARRHGPRPAGARPRLPVAGRRPRRRRRVVRGVRRDGVRVPDRRHPHPRRLPRHHRRAGQLDREHRDRRRRSARRARARRPRPRRPALRRRRAPGW